MGGFTLILGDDPDGTRAAAAARAMEARGFTITERLAAGPHRLLLAPSMVAAEPNLLRRGNDFAASSGTLFYKGLYGEDALAALLDLKGPPARDDISGCGVFILCRGGALRVFTDPPGTYKVYRDTGDTVWSDSFLAVAATLEKPALNPQGIYEYVFQGATYGNETVLEAVRLLDSDKIHHIGGRIMAEDWPGRIVPRLVKRPMEESVAVLTRLLGDRYAAIARAFGNRIDTALSGGYDSRLTLALLLEEGVTPHLHVYGRDDDPDVLVAKAVCAGEELQISHEDKSALGDDSPEGVAKATLAQLDAFDGFPPDGVIGNGSDLATRRMRCDNGVLALNGGGGEIFRNFFYLPNCRFSVRQMLWTFYSQFEPRWCTDQFNEAAYHARLGAKIAGIFEATPERLSRAEVEYVYPAFRGRFWTGRNTALNTHLGPALTPFLDHALVREAVTIPLAQKNHGVLEAAMIRAVSPALAGYLSDYGHDFSGPIPLKRRARDWLTYGRPPALRRLTYRMRMRLQPPVLAKYFSASYRQQYLPDGVRILDRYFDVGAVRDSAQMNRILTLELLFQRLNARTSP